MKTARKALIGALALLCLAAPASALAAPVLGVSSTHLPKDESWVPVGTHVSYTVTVVNRGTTDTTAPVTVRFSAPPGLTVTQVTQQRVLGFDAWSCAIAPDTLSASCTGTEIAGNPIPIGPAQRACNSGGADCRLYFFAKTDEAMALGPVSPTIEACGGGSVACGVDPRTTVQIGPAEFHLIGFDGNVLRADRSPATEAGSHPHTGSTTFSIGAAAGLGGATGVPGTFPYGQLKDAAVELPPGLVGNPRAYPTCTQSQLSAGNAGGAPVECPPESQVGTVDVLTLETGNTGDPASAQAGSEVGVYNMEVPFGLPALFGFNVSGNVTMVYGELRTGEDYGVTVTAVNAPQTLPVAGVDFTFWGVPADPSHDARRFRAGVPGATSSAPPRPFISLPTSCVGPGPNNSVETTLDVTSWEGGADALSFFSHDNTTPVPNPIGTEACNALTYTGPDAPSIQARPTTNVGDAPSGLDVDLRIPQDDSPTGKATAHLRDTTVTLPEGLVLNPGGANGLDGCSLSEFGYTSTDPDGTIHTTPEAATCPDAAKVATVQVDTPLLEDPLRGAAYVADPFANPFDSLLALYIVVDDPRTGIVVKLAGEVRLDPSTGRISTSVENNPQQPFENFELHFKSGPHGALRTPAICGNHTTTSSLTPWSAPDSGPPADPSDTWAITQNCSGSAAEQPHAPSFDAGAASPIAGAHSPFVVKLRREDGSQNFSAVTLSPPQGLVAKLAGTAICSDADLATAASKTGQAEKANPSCPAASEVGDVTAGAGAGPAPYYAPGKAYMAGPYKGAPLSLAIVTPATAGPFDLGTIVVKTALYVDSKTAEIKAVSDPIPSILQGIPLDVRTVDVSLDKPNFTLTGTSCDPMAVNGLLTSTLGQVANLSSRYQLGECSGLGFKPKMTLRLKGGTKRGKHPALTIALMPRAGDANIASVSVALPRSEFLENAHIRTVCTRPDFAADACPAGAVYGEATVDTPLLDYDLGGHVYLRSSDNLLPDVVPDLRGPAHQPIRLETAGRTDSIRGGIRTTIDFVPDAPFTKATVALQGGAKGLLVNSRNICAKTYRATVKFTAHNGATRTIRPKLVGQSCKKKKKRKGKRGGHRRR